MLEVIGPGLLTTIQDKGRMQYQKMGIPVAGAMDEFALAIGNLLVGNEQGEGALEITLMGPTLRFLESNTFALSGGTFEVSLDGTKLEINRAYTATKGSILQIGKALMGSRLYLAVAGGFDIEEIMGSQSTYLKGKIGGYKGRRLQEGDQIPFKNPRNDLVNMPYRFIARGEGINYGQSPTLRVVLGPQENHFSAKGLRSFFENEYKITPENDRMGYRLIGKAIEYAEGKDGNIISDGISFGAIQVTNKQPIIMMADRQTTGGYAKIGSVIRMDLPLVAQLKTGDTLRFKEVSIEEAQNLYIERMHYLNKITQHLNEEVVLKRQIYEINVQGTPFIVTVSEKN